MRIQRKFKPTRRCPYCKSRDVGFMPNGRHMDRLIEKCFKCDRKIKDVKLIYDPGEYYYKDKQIKDYDINFLKEELFKLKTRYHTIRKFLNGKLSYIWFNHKKILKGDKSLDDDMRSVIYYISQEIYEIHNWLVHNKIP